MVQREIAPPPTAKGNTPAVFTEFGFSAEEEWIRLGAPAA
jgi:hypothetical protein